MNEAREKIAELILNQDWRSCSLPIKWQSGYCKDKECSDCIADQILNLEVGDRNKGLTIRELIETALKAQEPIKAIVLRARQRPPLVLSDD